jgi:hypothetical protein
MGPGELKMLSQEVREIQPRQDMRIDTLAVDLERD